MLDLNIVHLKEFYETPLGKKVAGVLGRDVRGFTGEAKDEAVLALGYALPLLPDSLRRHNQLMVVMPATLGALYWPAGEDNRVVMAHDTELPLRESSVHRALALHALEHSESLPHMMSELAQILTPMGRALFLVPNRLSLWSHSGKSPFGYGRPFTLHQMKALLSEHGLTFVRARTSLFLPPGHSRPMVWLLDKCEWMGRFFLPMAGGVLMVEAQKQTAAPISKPVRRLAPVRAAKGVVAANREEGPCS